LAGPRHFAEFELVAGSLLQPIALTRREAAEFSHDLTALERIDHRRPLDEHSSIAVKIGLAGFEIIVKARADPMRAADMLDKAVRAGAHDVVCRPARI